MTATAGKREGSDRLIETVEHAEHSSLEAVRKFLDTVEGIFPHLRDDEPRRTIIDSAFEMTEAGSRCPSSLRVTDPTPIEEAGDRWNDCRRHGRPLLPDRHN